MIELRIGNPLQRVDTKPIDRVKVNFSIKDVTNYGKRNIAVSKPITVLSTPNSEKIFKLLSNINVTNGFDIGELTDGELLENGISVIKGSVRVIDSRPEEGEYDIIIFNSAFNIFNDIGDKLITGNVDPSNNITFTSGYFEHTVTRDFIRQQMNSDPSENGRGYTYSIIDYDNKLDSPADFQADYNVTGGIAAKEIWDKIFEDNGYTYELSNDISTYFNKMYIPFNDDILKYVTNWDFARLSIGEPTSILGDYPNGRWEIYNSIWEPNLGINFSGITKNTLFGSETSTGEYDLMKDSSYAEFKTYGYKIAKNGIYDINVGGLFGRSYTTDGGVLCGSPITGADTIFSIYITRTSGERNPFQTLANSYEIGKISGDIESTASTYVENTFEDVHLNRGDYIQFLIDPTADSAPFSRLAAYFDPSTFFQITEKNSFYANENVFDLNSLRPIDYKQADFLNDILKKFNCFIETDINDSKKLIIKSYTAYYADSSTKDWTEKIDNNTIKTQSIKNIFPKETIIKYSESKDIFNTDYNSKNQYSINSKQNINDSKFPIDINEIILSTASTVFKTITPEHTASEYHNIYDLEVPVITNGNQFLTNWKSRILFNNTVDVSGFVFGTDASNVVDPYVYKWNTLSLRSNPDINDSSTINLGFENTKTYLDRTAENNNNLYNLNYKKDIESNLHNNAFLLSADVKITPSDFYDLKFSDKIYLKTEKAGSGYFRINNVKDFNPDGLSKINFIKINYIDSDYDPSINVEKITRTILTLDETINRGTTSSVIGGSGTIGSTYSLAAATKSSIGGVIVGDHLDVDSTGLIDVSTFYFDGSLATRDASIIDLYSTQISSESPTFTGIATFENDVSIYGDVSIGGTLRGRTGKFENINISNDGDITNDLFVRHNVGISNDLTVTNDGNILNDLIVAKNAYIYTDAFITNDISVGNEVITDKIYGKQPFVSGYTGTGMQLFKQDTNDYRLELDDLFVRGSMTVNELNLNKIRANNGALMVSAAVEAIWVGDESDTPGTAGLFVRENSSNPVWFTCDPLNNTLQANDYIRSQQFGGQNVHQYDWIVSDSSGSEISVENTSVERNNERGYDSQMGMVNIDCDSFSENIAYDIIWTSNAQTCKTDFFTITGSGKITLNISWIDNGGADPGDKMWIRFYKDDGEDITDISDLQYLTVVDEEWVGDMWINEDALIEDPSCYILLRSLVDDTDVEEFAINSILDKTVPIIDVTGFTFNRMGNSTELNRQGAAYITAMDPNSPYLEILADMTSHDIGPSNRKVRLGNLDGLSYDDISIGGYGLWSEDVYLKGNINATTGLFGAWALSGGNITASDPSGRTILLDASDNAIILTDASNNLTCKIHNNDIHTIDDIGASSELRYADDAASDNTHNYMTIYGSGGGSDSSTFFISNLNAGVNTELNMKIADPGRDYDFVTSEQDYLCSIWAKIAMNYNLLDSSTLVNDAPYPPPHPKADPYTIYTTLHTISGAWNASSTTSFYDGDNNWLKNKFANIWTSGTLYNWQIFPGSFVPVPDASAYSKFELDITSTFVQTEKRQEWISNNGLWDLVKTTNTPKFLKVNFDLNLINLDMNGSSQLTEIGANGLITYWDDDKYFSVNKDRDNPIETGGTNKHKAGSSTEGTFTTFCDGDGKEIGNLKHSTGGLKIGVADTGGTIEDSMVLRNTSVAFKIENTSEFIIESAQMRPSGGGNLNIGDTTNYFGKVWANPTVDENEYEVQWNAATHEFTVNDTASDRRLKENLISIKQPIEDLMKISGYYFNFNKKAQEEFGFQPRTRTGLIAQDVQKVFPEVVGITHNKEYLKVRYEEMIPILVESIKEQQTIITKLNKDIEELKTYMYVLTQNVDIASPEVGDVSVLYGFFD